MSITVETIKQLLDDQFADEATLLSVSVSKDSQEGARIFVTTENSDGKPVIHSFEFKHDSWALVHSF
jgi:hypothetical protein